MLSLRPKTIRIGTTAGLVALVALAVVSGCSSGNGGGRASAARPSLLGLVFEPTGEHIAVLVASGGEVRRLYLVSTRNAQASPVFVSDCASRSASWLGTSQRLAFGTIANRHGQLVARTITGLELRSAASPAKAMGAIGTHGDLVAAIVQRADGRFEFWLWDAKADRLSRWEVPKTFTPSLASAPVISASGHVIALVNREASYFLGFDVPSQRWVMPVLADKRSSDTQRGPSWQWSEIGAADLAKQKWYAGSGLRLTSDRFYVDARSSVLWVAIINSPAGATPTGGHLRVIMTHDELVPLDLDNTQAMALSGGTTGAAPRVWPSYLTALSSDDERTNIAVVYRAAGGKVDCVLYTWEGSKWKQDVLATDLPAESPTLSLSPAGKLLALGRNGEQVEVVDAISGRTEAAWPLSRFAERQRQ